MPIAWTKILCPVDFSDESRAALRVAVDLATRFGAELTVFHAHTDERTASAPQARHATIAQWKGEAEKLGAARVGVDSVAGDPRLVIADYAQRNGYDLVVMGTHGRTGRDRLLIGSVAENVVRSSRVPVLTVHVDFDKKP
jgi:nucleotide-binding universal stress UspA family protein